MPEPSPPSPLTNQALSRLRKLAEGNGLAPDKIELIESQEKIYPIEGITQLVPYCELQPSHYPGPARGKDRVVLPNIGMLQAEAQRRRQEFLDCRDWLPAALDELKTAPGEGWGLDGAKIALPDKSAVLAASETCPACQGHKQFTCGQCQGQGVVVCSQCQGRGLEPCYNCGGRGENPAQPGQPCPICNGKRFAPCRFCRSSGKLVCPTCQGKRGTTCPECQGAGALTAEIALGCGATINFSLKAGEWPSGLRRGLDRLGIANLVKGHADVKRIPDEPAKGDAAADKAPTVIRYRAELPYADLKLRFGAQSALVSVFGKRGVMMGVPPFLDEALQPWRERLKQAALGRASLEDALEARALRDALTLEIAGQGKPDNLRRLYPVGLSPQAMQEILSGMRRALDRFTFHVRLGAAIFGGALGAVLLAGFMLMPLHALLTQTLPGPAGLALDLAALACVMGLGWVGLGKSVQFKLKRRFPDLKISLHRNAGIIGQYMLAEIGVAWIIILLLAPQKPVWFSYLMGLVIR